jgi:hypothetical protein
MCEAVLRLLVKEGIDTPGILASAHYDAYQAARYTCNMPKTKHHITQALENIKLSEGVGSALYNKHSRTIDALF